MASGLSSEEANALYRRYGALLGRRSRLLLRDVALAEDAVQELMAVLLHRGGALAQAAVPYRWLCRALDRVCLDLLRRGRRHRQALPLPEVDVLGPAPGLDAEARRVVLEGLEQLLVDDQQIAIAAFVDGCSQGEIAAELGLSRVTVNKRLARVRARLRLELSGALNEHENAHETEHDGEP